MSHRPSGTFVTATLVEGNLSVRWSVKAYPTALKRGLDEARKGALDALRELREVS